MITLIIVTIILAIILAIILSSLESKSKISSNNSSSNTSHNNLNAVPLSTLNSSEKFVRSILRSIPGFTRIFNNVMFNDNGKSRQIDHIFINKNGVFVIETKDYAGVICGKETSNIWHQYLGKKSYDFYNPINQNYGHKKIISNILYV